MTNKIKIGAHYQSEFETRDWVYGYSLLSKLFQGTLEPSKIGAIPDNYPAAYDSIDACHALWAQQGALGTSVKDFSWKRTTRIKSHGYVTHSWTTRQNVRIPGWFFLECEFDEKFDWLSLFAELIALGQFRFAAMHLFSSNEDWRGTFTSPENSFRLMSVGSDNRHIENLGWASLFGEGFARHVDVKRLEANGFFVRTIGQAHLVTVTNDIGDIVHDFPKFSRRRAELKSLFPPGLFLIIDEPPPMI